MGRQWTINSLPTFVLRARFFWLAAALCIGASSMHATEYATKTPEQEEPVSVDMLAPSAVTPPPYVYQVSARPDPFKPFVAPQRVDPNELLDDTRELTGMQLFEPGQLSLVGILDTPRGRVAMVEDVTKKGYLLREGVLLGRYGKVTEIGRDQVVITETAYTRGGEEITTVVAMKLQKDGEGQ